jgi:hypothetical protein
MSSNEDHRVRRTHSSSGSGKTSKRKLEKRVLSCEERIEEYKELLQLYTDKHEQFKRTMDEQSRQLSEQLNRLQDTNTRLHQENLELMRRHRAKVAAGAASTPSVDSDDVLDGGALQAPCSPLYPMTPPSPHAKRMRLSTSTSNSTTLIRSAPEPTEQPTDSFELFEQLEPSETSSCVRTISKIDPTAYEAVSDVLATKARAAPSEVPVVFELMEDMLFSDIIAQLQACLLGGGLRVDVDNITREHNAMRDQLVKGTPYETMMERCTQSLSFLVYLLNERGAEKRDMVLFGDLQIENGQSRVRKLRKEKRLMDPKPLRSFIVMKGGHIPVIGDMATIRTSWFAGMVPGPTEAKANLPVALVYLEARALQITGMLTTEDSEGTYVVDTTNNVYKQLTSPSLLNNKQWWARVGMLTKQLKEEPCADDTDAKEEHRADDTDAKNHHHNSKRTKGDSQGSPKSSSGSASDVIRVDEKSRKSKVCVMWYNNHRRESIHDKCGVTIVEPVKPEIMKPVSPPPPPPRAKPVQKADHTAEHQTSTISNTDAKLTIAKEVKETKTKTKTKTKTETSSNTNKRTGERVPREHAQLLVDVSNAQQQPLVSSADPVIANVRRQTPTSSTSGISLNIPRTHSRTYPATSQRMSSAMAHARPAVNTMAVSIADASTASTSKAESIRGYIPFPKDLLAPKAAMTHSRCAPSAGVSRGTAATGVYNKLKCPTMGTHFDSAHPGTGNNTCPLSTEGSHKLYKTSNLCNTAHGHTQGSQKASIQTTDQVTKCEEDISFLFEGLRD